MLRKVPRHLAQLVLIGLSLLCASSSGTRAESTGGIHLAQSLVLPDGRFNSTADYLVGSWLSYHAGDTRRLHFSRNGDFSFNSQLNGTDVYGRYDATPNEFRITILRVCGRGNCENRQPSTQTYPLRPIDVGEFRSADEIWRRTSR